MSSFTILLRTCSYTCEDLHTPSEDVCNTHFGLSFFTKWRSSKGTVRQVYVCMCVCVCVCVCDAWLVNTISQDSNDRHFSYLVYRFVMLRGRTLLFLVKVKGHLRSPEVKTQKSCKHRVPTQPGNREKVGNFKNKIPGRENREFSAYDLEN